MAQTTNQKRVTGSGYLHLTLQQPEMLDPRVRDELEQLIAALQLQSRKIIPLNNLPVDEFTLTISQITGILAGVGIVITPSGQTLSVATETEEQVSEVTLTHAQLLDLYATPVNLVPAPGAGRVADPLTISFSSNFTTAYNAVPPNLRFRYAGLSTDLFIPPGHFMNMTTKRLGAMKALGHIVNTASALNQPIQLSSDLTVTGGNAANRLRIRTYYRIITPI